MRPESANVVVRTYLSRRTILRGAGGALALPLLDCMTPAFASASAMAAIAPRRLGAIYAPNGMNMADWTSTGVGEVLQLSPILEPIRAHIDKLTVVNGLCNNAADQIPGEGTGDHSRSSAAYLTGMHARKTEGADLYNGVSMDQVAARVLGKETQLASLELALEANDLAGGCEHGYSCAYTGTIAWATPNTPLPMETDPRAVFERLFGASESTDRAARLARLRRQRSILDAVSERLSELRRQLGAGDLAKVGEYAEAVRAVERRIQKAEEQSDRELPAVSQPASVPDSYEEYAKVMFDLWALAFQADLTRVGTFMFGREKSVRSYPEIGVPEPHHPLSHHQGRPELLTKLTKLNTFHMRLFGHFLDRLRSTREGDGTLLDSVAVIYGSGMSNPDMHLHQDLPMMVAGGAGGALRGGRLVTAAKGTPLANLHLTILEKYGIAAGSLGDSTGLLSGV